MKIALYGVPCQEKERIRTGAPAVISETDPQRAGEYDVLLYLALPLEVLQRELGPEEARRQKAAGEEEIESLRRYCHEADKDFYAVDQDVNPQRFGDFVRDLEHGFSSYGFARKIVERIREIYPVPGKIHISDGDKTLIRQDSFHTCIEFDVTVFRGNYYTGYQAWRFTQVTQGLSYDFSKMEKIFLHEPVFDQIKDENYVILSSGVSALWNRLGEKFHLKSVMASTKISGDTKFFVVKLLKAAGYTVHAYGDSRNDLYMLWEAHKGTFCIGSRMSRSVLSTNVDGPEILTEPRLYDYGLSGDHPGRELGIGLQIQIPAVETALLPMDGETEFVREIWENLGGNLHKDSSDITENRMVLLYNELSHAEEALKAANCFRKQNPHATVWIVAHRLHKTQAQALSGESVFCAEQI